MTVWIPAYSEALISDHDRRLIEEVAWACRILAMVGYEDLTLGHVSARGSDDSTIYIKRKGWRWARSPRRTSLPSTSAATPATAAKGCTWRPCSTQRSTSAGRTSAASCTGIPRTRPRSGPPTPSSRTLTHDSVMFIDRISTYDGVPDLIVDEQQGAAVAEALGSGTALLLRNHGVLVAERDVQWAVLASALLERATQLQAIATSIGPLHPIPDRLLHGIHAVKYQSDFAASTGTRGYARCAAAARRSACPRSR